MKKKLFATILILLLLAFPILGANTHVIDLEEDSSQYLSIVDGSQVGLDLASDFTFELWARWESVGNSKFHNKFTNFDRAYAFDYYHDDTKLRLGTDSNGGPPSPFIQVEWEASVNTWYHIAVAYDLSAGEATFYIDGSQQGTTQSGGDTSLYNTDESFKIGMQENVWYMDGKFDDIRVWSDIRTEQEIDDNKCLELTGSEANLVAYWKLNNDATDSQAGGNNDLTENNSPTYTTDFDPCFAPVRRIIMNDKILNNI